MPRTRSMRPSSRLPARKPPGERGFTLLEVLLAVTIFSAVMGALIGIVTTNIRRLTDARAELRVMAIAEEQMRQILADSINRMPERAFRLVFQVLMTMLALRLLWRAAVDAGFL